MAVKDISKKSLVQLVHTCYVGLRTKRDCEDVDNLQGNFFTASLVSGENMKHYIIPIFIPHMGCPHQCVFCNQHKITGVDTTVTPAEIKEKIAAHTDAITRPYYVEAAFYGGSFTALTLERQRELLAPAADFLQRGKIHGIRLSTRPDCITEKNLLLLQEMGVKTIELGAQSFADKVLQKAERGHLAEDTFQAAALIKKAGFKLGVQLMPGLPGENEESLQLMLESTLQIKPDLVRIYPTLVLKGTKLAEMYAAGEYQPLSLEQAIDTAARLKLAFEENGIRVIRTGLQSSEELDNPENVKGGPYDPAFGEMAENRIFLWQIQYLLQKLGASTGECVIYHAPCDTSKVRGVKKRNLIKLQELYPQLEFHFTAAGRKGEITVEYNGEEDVSPLVRREAGPLQQRQPEVLLPLAKHEERGYKKKQARLSRHGLYEILF